MFAKTSLWFLNCVELWRHLIFSKFYAVQNIFPQLYSRFLLIQNSTIEVFVIGGEQRLIKNINLNTFIFVWFPSEEIIKYFPSNVLTTATTSTGPLEWITIASSTSSSSRRGRRRSGSRRGRMKNEMKRYFNVAFVTVFSWQGPLNSPEI